MIEKGEIKKVVYSTLVSDIFHYGHLQLLKKAKSLGDYHICGVQTDEAVKSYRQTPLSSFQERRAIISCLRCVDRVINQNSFDSTENLKKIHQEFPDAEIIFVHGEKSKNIPGEEFVKNIGGKIINISSHKRFSDFDIIKKILQDSKSKFERFKKLAEENKLISTKANTLKALYPILTKSEIKKPFIFTLNDWETKQEKIISEIQKQFNPKTIVIRSSALNEDTSENSMAGVYRSILNVDSTNGQEIKNSINQVINSYEQKGIFDKANQILVQEQVKNIRASGVIFTREIVNGAPYYVINYDNITGSTDSVTKGIEHKVVKISYFCKSEFLKQWGRLIESVHELERVIPGFAFDIEFAITTEDKIIFFQVRPLTSRTITNYKHIDFKVKKETNLIKNKYKEVIKNKYKIFSNMSFWNPAEIIGDFPNSLDYSLYAYIITDGMWQKLLIPLGYSKTSPKLMISFANRPYIDVTKSFEFLTPEKISALLKNKLLNFYHQKLINNPELHDKIEFDISHNCYTLSFDLKIQELKENGFNELEINEIKQALFSLTNRIITNYNEFVNEAEKDSLIMETRRKEILKGNSSKKDKVRLLLDDCKNLGGSHFSLIARFAFIGKSFLISLLEKQIIDEGFYNKFLSSLKTVASDFKKDIHFKDFNSFLDKYGHLRPGTYDILSKRYDKYPKSFFNPLNLESYQKEDEKFEISEQVHTKINKILQEKGFLFNSNHLFNFIMDSLEKRELLKFRFTKNLSDALEIIAEIGSELGFSRMEISNVPIKDLFFNLDISDKERQIRNLKRIIIKKKAIKKVYKKILLPPIIFSEESLDIIKIEKASPNFITQKQVSGEPIFLNSSSISDIQNISVKIVLIENADPGFDWIFTKNIKGLITKYGGAASHMAIRCAEFEIPAAIGCGEELFNKLINSKNIYLNCKIEKLEVI